MNKIGFLSIVRYIQIVFCFLPLKITADHLRTTIQSNTNVVFVEVGGIAAGDAISYAWAAGSQKIYMIDSNPVLINHAKYLFSTFFDLCPIYRPIRYSSWKPELNYYIGNSAYELKDIIKNINHQITFFLHSYIPDPDNSNIPNNIIAELLQIQEHHIKNHTILIDNIDFAGSELFGNISLEEVLCQLRLINKDYTISFSFGGHQGRRPNALLIAQLR